MAQTGECINQIIIAYRCYRETEDYTSLIRKSYKN